MRRVARPDKEDIAMQDLLRRPFGAHGKVHEITPQSAGWRYVGFSLYRLRRGRERGVR